METKEQEIERLLAKAEEMFDRYDVAIKRLGKSIDRLGKVVEKGLKELEDENT